MPAAGAHLPVMTWLLEFLLPLLALGALGAVLPVVLVRVLPKGRQAVLLSVVASAWLLWIGGALLFLGLYLLRGVPLPDMASGSAVGHFLSLGLRSALVWGPVLALAGLALAQREEARQGREAARRDRD